MALQSVLEAIITRLGRQIVELKAVQQVFAQNWITEPEHWLQLSYEKRQTLGLPLMLQIELDRALSRDVVWEVGLIEQDEQEGLKFVRIADDELWEGSPLAPLENVVPDGYECIPEAEDPAAGTLCEQACWRLLEHSPALSRLRITRREPASCLPASGATSNSSGPPPSSPPPTRRLVVRETMHAAGGSGVVVSWLRHRGLCELLPLLWREPLLLHDFFVLVFVGRETLEQLGARGELLERACTALEGLRSLSRYELLAEWLRHCGAPEAAVARCVAERLDLCSARLLRPVDLARLGLPEDSRAAQALRGYAAASSVQETFAWLRQQGFARLAFHFARYNIPAYALPYVNFFILDEMGGWASAGSAPGDALLARLRELRGSAGYAAWSCAAWLRDLDLERWNLSLARVCRSLEALAALPDSDAELARLVPVPADREKLQAGRRELREFQQYYSATGSLLQRHGLERHAPAFLRHGISVDVLALLTDAQLQLIGIEPAEERLRLLQALRSLSSPVTASSAASSSSSSATTAAAASTAARSSSALAAGARTSSTGGRTGDAGRARVRGEAGAGLRTQGAPSVRQLVSSVHREDRRSIDDLVEFIQQRSTAPPSTKTAATTRASTASSGKGKQKQQQQQQKQQQKQQQQQRASSKAAARAAAAATPPKASENSNTPRSPATVSSVPAPPAPVTSDAEAAPADSSVANGQPAREAPPPGNAEAEAEAAASREDVEAGMWAALDAEVEEFRRRLEQCSSGALSRPRIAVALPGLHAKPASRVPA